MPKYPESILRGAGLPPRLLDLPSPPATLFVRGELPRGASVSIVGTRHPSSAGRRYARTLARELAQEGVAVLSGGALGIDGAAHRGALDAGGITVVVAPSGWERPSPKEHRLLFRRAVQAGGAHVSLVPATAPAIPAHYFPRNAVLAALAHVVVVVEAPFRSGARNTARTARELGRPLFVCAAPPWHEAGHGCTLEVRLGARPLLSTRDILRHLVEQRAHPVPTGGARTPATSQQLLLRADFREATDNPSVSEPSPKEVGLETV
ncbi:MAG TPA: DNA-processing protein DprA [Polyangiaceae bacterium]